MMNRDAARILASALNNERRPTEASIFATAEQRGVSFSDMNGAIAAMVAAGSVREATIQDDRFGAIDLLEWSAPSAPAEYAAAHIIAMALRALAA